MIVLEATSQLNPMQHQATAIVRSCLSNMRSLYELRSIKENNLSIQVRLVLTGKVGRPHISYEQLSFLIENRLSEPQIADMVGVSVRTIQRRMSEFGLSISSQYTTITNLESDVMVSEIQHQFNAWKQTHTRSSPFERILCATKLYQRVKNRSRWSNNTTCTCP